MSAEVTRSVEPPHPWLQLEGEPAAAYARFLAYRNLGPARSVVEAARSIGDDPKGTKRHRPASGSWKANCQHYRWVERAQAWDLHQLHEVAEHVQVSIVALANSLAKQGIKLINDSPNGWRAGLEIFTLLAQLVYPPEGRSESN